MNKDCSTCKFAKNIDVGLTLCEKMNIFVFDCYVPTQEFYTCYGSLYIERESK